MILIIHLTETQKIWFYCSGTKESDDRPLRHKKQHLGNQRVSGNIVRAGCYEAHDRGRN
jgi:hypothetical protein